MKLSILLMVIGSLLIAEGGSRITVGIILGNPGLIIGGIITGLLLGGFLLYRGIKRQSNVNNAIKGGDISKTVH